MRRPHPAIRGSRTLTAPVFAQALGPALARLHPRLQEQYGITSASRLAFRGRGVMETVYRGRWYTVPFLHIAANPPAIAHEEGRGTSPR